MPKTCSLCHTIQPLSEYYFNSRTGKHIASCKNCRKIKTTEYRAANDEKIKACKHKHYLKNKDKIYAKQKEWVEKNRKHVQAYQQAWISENRDKHNGYNRKRNARLKKQVMDAYGNKCACCGEDAPGFLTIDHVNNDGNDHRKRVHGDKIYAEIIREEYPAKYQILCWNCNVGRHHNGGVCPHKSLKVQRPSREGVHSSEWKREAPEKGEDMVSSARRRVAAKAA